MKRFLLASICLLLLPLAAQDLPPISSERVAAKLVASLKPASGERAILAYDPNYYPELTRELEKQLNAAGASEVTKIAFDDPRIAGKPEADAIAALRPEFERADIFIWLPGRNVGGDRRWERLLDAGKARCIHFHWISRFSNKSPEEIATLTRLYERAVLDSDYAALSREQDRLIAALRGKEIRITTASGTDLRMRVPPDAWFHKNDGDISLAGARRGPALRDRQMEFPAGALRFIPDWKSVQGMVVTRDRASGQETRLRFVNGRLAQMASDVEGLRLIPMRVGGDIDKVGEIVIGTNPLLVTDKPMPSGELPYYGYGAGYVRVSLGDNWESGGPLRVPGTMNYWLFLEHASLEAGGKPLIRADKLVK